VWFKTFRRVVYIFDGFWVPPHTGYGHFRLDISLPVITLWQVSQTTTRLSASKKSSSLPRGGRRWWTSRRAPSLRLIPHRQQADYSLSFIRRSFRHVADWYRVWLVRWASAKAGLSTCDAGVCREQYPGESNNTGQFTFLQRYFFILAFLSSSEYDVLLQA
jgi:hypothetical protein